MMRSRPAIRAAAACVVLFALCAQAGAASLQVSPTSVTVQAGQNAGGLTLSNTGTTPVHAQVRVYRWTQHDGEDRLEPTRDIAVSPPMLELAPGDRQLIRVIRPGAPPSGTEASYRLIVDELPVEGAADAAKPGLQFMLRYSVPVFVMPRDVAETATAIVPVLRTRLVRDGGRSFIEIANSGRQHAQVADLAFIDADGKRHAVAAGLSGYVLPGQARRWPLPATSTAPVAGTFKARINGEPVERSLPLDQTAP